MSRKANKDEHHSGLTVKAQQAVEHYLVHGNYADAYREGFGRGKCNQTTFDKKVQTFFKRPLVVAEIRRRREELSKKTDLTVERVLQGYMEIGFTNIGEVVDFRGGAVVPKSFDELTDAQKGAIQSIKQRDTRYGAQIEVRMHPRKPALDSLAEFLGMFQREKDKGKGLQDVPLININLGDM